MTAIDRSRAVRLGVRVLSWVVLGAIAGGAALAFAVLTVVPRMTHGAALTVLTGSMTPEIPVGSVVVIRPVDPGTLEVGDVATYQVSPSSQALITHRVQSISEEGGTPVFVFKGDANRGADAKPVPAAAIRGEVWFHVPWLGGLRDALHGRAGFSLLAVVLLVGYAVRQVVAGVRDRRAPDPAGDQPAEDERTTGTTVPLDRPLVLATLDVESQRTRLGQGPAEAAATWGGLLLSEGPETFTVALTPTRDGLEAALALLVALEATEVVVVEPGDLHVPAEPQLLPEREGADSVAA